jgi:hypothetical protein
MKVFLNDNTINTMNNLMGQNNQKLIMGGILIEVILVNTNNILV